MPHKGPCVIQPSFTSKPLLLGLNRLLANPEDYKLGGLHWCDADVANQPAVIDVVLRHRGAIAFDEERFFLRHSHQCAGAPHADQEVGDAAPHPGPEWLVVWFKHDPLRAFVNGLFDEQEEPPHVDVFPLTVRRHRARAPETNASTVAAEIAGAVDTTRIENVLSAFRYRKFQIACAANDFVSRRFVHATLDIR